MRKNSAYLEIYDKIITEKLKMDFIEEVLYEDKFEPNSKIHYLSHHAIHKDSITTPLRIVFDCSAKASKYSPSLNEFLHSGPSLINNICSVLMS